MFLFVEFRAWEIKEFIIGQFLTMSVRFEWEYFLFFHMKLSECGMNGFLYGFFLMLIFRWYIFDWTWSRLRIICCLWKNA